MSVGFLKYSFWWYQDWKNMKNIRMGQEELTWKRYSSKSNG